MSMTVEERKAANKALIEEVLKAYPDKMAKRRAKHIGQYEEGKPDCGVKSNIQVAARRHDHPRLRLCRLQGCGVGAHQGHGPHQPRPGGLRPVQAGRRAATTTSG